MAQRIHHLASGRAARRCRAGRIAYRALRRATACAGCLMAAPKGFSATARMGAGLSAELREIPEAVRRQAAAIGRPLGELMTLLARRPPNVVVTCARGSSAHAATFAKHLLERYLGIPVAAAALNIASVYRRELRLRDQLLLAISQSGASDDLVETASAARTSGALTVEIGRASC